MNLPPGSLVSVGPFDVNHEDLTVRLMNIGFGYEEDASLVLVLGRAGDQWGSKELPRWDVIVLHRTGEMRFCDAFRFPASMCNRIL